MFDVQILTAKTRTRTKYELSISLTKIIVDIGGINIKYINIK